MLVAVRIGPLSLPTYPLLLLLGLYLGLWFGAKVAGRRGLDPNHIYNAGFYAFLAALLSGRLAHVLRFLPAYAGDPLSILSPNLVAFEPLAALAGAVLVFGLYVRRHRLPTGVVADALAAGALMTLAFVSLADALNGRHFGAPTLLPWSLVQWDVYRHPVQLYEMLGIIAVLALIWAVLDRLRTGYVALVAIAGYATVRLLADAFRDQPATIGDGFRLTQVIALVALLLVLMTVYQMQRQPAGRP